VGPPKHKSHLHSRWLFAFAQSDKSEPIMSINTASSYYPAKLLLFGEYTIIQGAKALAVPLFNFRGQWRQGSDVTTLAEQQKGLYQLLHYLQKHYKAMYDTAAFEEALLGGEYFDSTIPQGYGAGSSGALSAAVYDRFAFSKIPVQQSSDLKQLQQQLATIESCFHGASSGADPLVCYLRKGVIFNGKNVQLLSTGQAHYEGFFLMDTGISRQTAPLVKVFKKYCEEEIYPLRLEVELIPLVEDAIDAFLSRDVNVLLETMHQISYFQFKYFPGMIPETYRKLWLDALASEHTKLKLCGAGGGGFLLGYSVDMTQTKHLLADYKLVELSAP
jgi:mevalonate kinase